MTETNAKDTARRNLHKVAIFAHTAGLDELEVRKIVAQAYREAQETPEQEAVRESLEASWPAGCIKMSSCARNRSCMYGWTPEMCRHHGRDIGPEVDAETARRAGAGATLGELAARGDAEDDARHAALNGLARRESFTPFIITEDGTRLERGTGRTVVASFYDGEHSYDGQ